MIKFKRVLLKLSGETLAGHEFHGINDKSLDALSLEIQEALAGNIELAIVIGGGNIWRGAGKGIDRVTADYMGMLATVINGLALKDALARRNIKAAVFSAINMPKICELFTKDKALKRISNGEVLIFVAGTGNPYFTTDTTAALRASEIKADVLLKATQVDGVYDKDPKLFKDAKKYDSLSYDTAIEKKLKIMDQTAFSLAKDNALPIIVFDFHKKGNILKVISGEQIGTLIS